MLFCHIDKLTALRMQTTTFLRKSAQTLNKYVWAWFDANRHWLEVHQLPSYSPELNPTERLWRHTRQTGTHNRYFPDEKELTGTLSRVFGEMQNYPELIRPYFHSFFCSLFPFIYPRTHTSNFHQTCIP